MPSLDFSVSVFTTVPLEEVEVSVTFPVELSVSFVYVLITLPSEAFSTVVSETLPSESTLTSEL